MKFARQITTCALGLIALGAFTASLRAGIDTSDPTLPTTGTDLSGHATGYLTATQVHTTYSGPGLTAILSMAIHQPFGSVFRSAVGPGGADEQELFNSNLTGELSINGSPDQPITANGQVTTVVHGKIGNVTGTFNTEMLAMNLSAGGGVFIRESPTLASTGQTSITPIGGGNFHIDSFFDIFTELSVDGGNTWMPGNSTGPGGSSLVTLEALPEPGTALCGIALCGVALFRRRRGMLRA